MKTKLWILALLLIVPLAGCGLIYGQMTKAGDGIKLFSVLQGDLAKLKEGGDLLVYAPFAKTERAFYVARGEEAASFATHLEKQGLFRTEYLFESDIDDVEKSAQQLRGMSAAEVQQQAGMASAPRMILFGTLLERHESVAPTRGVLMDITYQLEFYDVASRQSTIIEVQVRNLAENCVTEVVNDLAQRL
ncbi:MAG: hypothetical protein C0624_03515 [Desulfuromonas sp.]|nr:MAG: hypothetical protein C0624_03515 [Desulfuromonas sp.]